MRLSVKLPTGNTRGPKVRDSLQVLLSAKQNQPLHAHCRYPARRLC